MIDILFIVGIVVLAVLIVAAAAPLESLGWWAGWKDDPDDIERRLAAAASDATSASAEAYVVYLSGVGAISGTELLPNEAEFIDALKERLPEARVLSDVFPYAATGIALTGNRSFASFWRLLRRMRLRGENTLVALVNVRNLFQVLVSADERYGPVFNYGTSRVITESLVRHGYQLGSGVPVVLLGSSGGGQIAIGAATYLQPTIRGPVEAVSLGGVMNSDPGLDVIAHLVHLYGEPDSVARLGGKVFPQRWKRYPGSAWNRALREGKIDFVDIGPLEHNGKGGYMDPSTTLDDGRPCLEHSVAAVADAIEARLGSATAEGS